MEDEKLHWAEKSTPLLGRRARSPIDNSDDEDSMSILPLAVKRRNISLLRGKALSSVFT